MTKELKQAAQQALEALTTLHNVYTAMRQTLHEKYPEDGWSAETMTLDQARAAIDALEDALTAAQPAQAGEVDERVAFEAYIRKDCGDLSMFGSGANVHYVNSAVNNSWIGWQARASLPTQPAAQATPEPVGEPALWVPTKQLDQRETTTRGYLWFSNPQNDSWTPLYTRPAPGVPEWFAMLKKVSESAVYVGGGECSLSMSLVREIDAFLAAAQAKGADHG